MFGSFFVFNFFQFLLIVSLSSFGFCVDLNRSEQSMASVVLIDILKNRHGAYCLNKCLLNIHHQVR